MAILHFKFRQLFCGQQIENGIKVEGTAIGAIDALPIAQLMVNQWQSELSSVLSQYWSMTEVVYRLEPASPGAPFLTLPVANVPFVGDVTISPTPTHATCTVSLRSTDGPPYRGYIALGGFGGNRLDANANWDSGTMGQVGNWIQNIRNSLNVGYNGADIAIVSTGSTQVPSGTSSSVETVIVQPIVGIRSSRKVGRGV